MTKRTNRTPSKLSLHRQTVRALSGEQLRAAQGGRKGDDWFATYKFSDCLTSYNNACSQTCGASWCDCTQGGCQG